MVAPPVIPELNVADLERSLAFYEGVLGFSRRFERQGERFVYLVRGAVHLMIEEATGPGRRFRPDDVEHAFGRGLNLQIEVPDVDLLYAAAAAGGVDIVLQIEERWYRQHDEEAGNRQFVAADPDGFLLRFFTSLGRRPVADAGTRKD